MDDGVKNDVKRPGGQSFMRNAAHREKMEKRRKASKKGIRSQHRGMKSKNWRKFWNKEGWKEAQLEVMQNVPELFVD